MAWGAAVSVSPYMSLKGSGKILWEFTPSGLGWCGGAAHTPPGTRRLDPRIILGVRGLGPREEVRGIDLSQGVSTAQDGFQGRGPRAEGLSGGKLRLCGSGPRWTPQDRGSQAPDPSP